MNRVFDFHLPVDVKDCCSQAHHSLWKSCNTGVCAEAWKSASGATPMLAVVNVESLAGVHRNLSDMSLHVTDIPRQVTYIDASAPRNTTYDKPFNCCNILSDMSKRKGQSLRPGRNIILPICTLWRTDIFDFGRFTQLIVQVC